MMLIVINHIQLQQHHAAGNARDVVLYGVFYSVKRTVHARSQYARLGSISNRYKSNALFHRRNAYRVYTWWESFRNKVSVHRSNVFFCRNGYMGSGELQKERMIYDI